MLLGFTAKDGTAFAELPVDEASHKNGCRQFMFFPSANTERKRDGVEWIAPDAPPSEAKL